MEVPVTRERDFSFSAVTWVGNRFIATRLSRALSRIMHVAGKVIRGERGTELSVPSQSFPCLIYHP